MTGRHHHTALFRIQAGVTDFQLVAARCEIPEGERAVAIGEGGNVRVRNLHLGVGEKLARGGVSHRADDDPGAGLRGGARKCEGECRRQHGNHSAVGAFAKKAKP